MNTSLTIPEVERALPAAANLPALFEDPAKIDETLQDIRTLALSYVPDLSTDSGRKAVASLAAKVAHTKVVWDDVGKHITEDARRQLNAVNAERKKIRDTLDALKREVRQPLTDWEQQEKDRVADLRLRMRRFYDVLDGTWDRRNRSKEDVVKHIELLETTPTDDDTWDEFQEEADGARAEALAYLRDRLAEIEQQEAEEAERQRREAAIAAKEAEQAAKEAELEAERQRLAHLEREREREEKAAQREKDRQVELEKIAQLREERARAEAQAAAERRERELREAHEREMEEARLEAERVAQRQREAERAEAEEQERRRQDKAHRECVRGEISESLRGYVAPGGLVCDDIADALMDGKIPHTRVIL